MNDWSDQKTGDPLYADLRDFYKVREMEPGLGLAGRSSRDRCNVVAGNDVNGPGPGSGSHLSS